MDTSFHLFAIKYAVKQRVFLISKFLFLLLYFEIIIENNVFFNSLAHQNICESQRVIKYLVFHNKYVNPIWTRK